MMRFSAKQRRVLTWWRPDSPDAAFEAIICDGAVRLGQDAVHGAELLPVGERLL